MDIETFQNAGQGITIKSSVLTEACKKMAVGLAITAVIAYGSYTTGLYATVAAKVPLLWLIFLIVQVVLTHVMCTGLNGGTSVQTMTTMFVVYSVMMGFTMAGLGYTYNLGEIGVSLGITAVYFGCLAIVGKTTKTDLSKLGTLCAIALLAMLVSQIIMMFVGVSTDTRLWSVIGLLIFTGLTAWDVQKMSRLSYSYETDRLAMYFALQLYLDFINIFLYILRLMASRDNKR